MALCIDKKIIQIEKPDYFDLDETLNCGQSFRFRQCEDGFYEGVVKEKYLRVALSNDKKYILFANTDEDEIKNIWTDYFDLNTDYNKIVQEISEISPLMQKIVEHAPGIRILRQEPFEALCSFIISQNNNIPRITKIISSLCERYGNKCENSDEKHCFPSVDVMASLSEKELRAVGCGFRDKYLLDAAKKIKSNEINLEEISNMELEKARATLQKIKGVGPKVADCILLYGMHRLECFPVDVWIKKAMCTLFPEKDVSSFGKYAGIAQQYIYHYSRKNSEIFENEC